MIMNKYNIVKNKMISCGFDYRYLEKTIKNYGEGDYGDAMVGLGKTLESFAKTILQNEQGDDVLITLIDMMYAQSIISSKEKTILMDIRGDRNENAHGQEIYKEISKTELEYNIILVLDFLEKNIKKTIAM